MGPSPDFRLDLSKRPFFYGIFGERFVKRERSPKSRDLEKFTGLGIDEHMLIRKVLVLVYFSRRIENVLGLVPIDRAARPPRKIRLTESIVSNSSLLVPLIVGSQSHCVVKELPSRQQTLRCKS